MTNISKVEIEMKSYINIFIFIVKKCTYQKTARFASKNMQCSFQIIKNDLLLFLFLFASVVLGLVQYLPAKVCAAYL